MPRNLGAEAAHPYPRYMQQEHPKGLPYLQPRHDPCPLHPFPAQAPVTLTREFSGEIRTIIILIIIIIRGEEGGENTLKLSKTPQTLRIVKHYKHM